MIIRNRPVPVALLALVAAVIAMPSGGLADEPTPAWLVQSRALTQQLGTQLKAELSAAIQRSGPAGAIEVCRTRAPEIAAQLSRESGATVGRTALKFRNPANAPDELQRALLEQFAADMAEGKVMQPIEAAVEIDRGPGIERRYMRAIPTEPLCLACHGPNLAPDVQAALDKAYSNDQATGFAAGQLRGAFSVIWPPVPRPNAH